MYHGTHITYIDDILQHGVSPPVFFTTNFEIAVLFSCGKRDQLSSIFNVTNTLDFLVIEFEAWGLDFVLDRYPGKVLGNLSPQLLKELWMKWQEQLFVTNDCVQRWRFTKLISNVGEFELR